ncbi:hypothetical protein BGZ82_002234, partial [Podila clonocystis]
ATTTVTEDVTKVDMEETAAAMEDTSSTSSPHSRRHQADMVNSMVAMHLLLPLPLLLLLLLPPLATLLSSRLHMHSTTVTNTAELTPTAPPPALPLHQQPLDPMPSPLLLPRPPTLQPTEPTTTPAMPASTDPLLFQEPPPRLLLPRALLLLPLATLLHPPPRTLLPLLITRPTTPSRDTARRPTSSTTASTMDTREELLPQLRPHHHQRLLLPLLPRARVRTRSRQSLLFLLPPPLMLLLRTILPRLRKGPN